MDVAFTYVQTPHSKPYAVHVSASPNPTRVVCRCGTQIPRGGQVIRVEGLPDGAAELFADRAFCSPRCLRAFGLESLETLDGLDTPAARAVVTDLHELYRGLAKAFAQILSET